jgi:phosphate transport system ATP-binding protein
MPFSTTPSPYYRSIPAAPAQPILRVRNLSCFYGRQKAIEDVSMEIHENKVTAVIGPSGCGKSTFLKTLNRIGEMEGNLRIQGKVELLGQDIYTRSTNLNRLRRQVGMIFQQPNPFSMSIYDNVAYGIRTFSRPSRKILDEIVESALQSAALWDEVKDKLKHPALALSGGQQQRLCIARALAVKPKVLLMDEPCSALDPIATMKIETLIQELQHELTIVIVTHNMQQAARVSEYTAFFSVDAHRIGYLVEFDTTAQLFMEASHSDTRDYVAGRFG